MANCTRALLIITSITFVLVGCSNDQVAMTTTVSVLPSITPAFKVASPTITPEPLASMQFLETVVELGGIQWMEHQAIENGVGLKIRGVYALNKDEVFLLGALTVPAGTIRSILMRSDDGGNHWREVLSPVPGSDVLRITFLDDGEGWVLVGWTVEDPGPFVMYHSSDYGQSWDKLSEIPNVWGVPYGIKFFDYRNGQIKMVYQDRLSVLSTVNGGIAWEETDSIPIWEEWKGAGYTPTLAIDISDKVELRMQFAALTGWKEENDGWSNCFWNRVRL